MNIIFIKSIKEKVIVHVVVYSNISTFQKIFEDTANDSTMHIIKAGDTLYYITRKFNITANELKQVHHLTSNVLRIGQVLQISTF